MICPHRLISFRWPVTFKGSYTMFMYIHVHAHTSMVLHAQFIILHSLVCFVYSVVVYLCSNAEMLIYGIPFYGTYAMM